MGAPLTGQDDDPSTDEDMRRRFSDLVIDHMYGLTGAPWDDDYTRARALCTTLHGFVISRGDYWRPRVREWWDDLVASDVLRELYLDEQKLAELARLVERWHRFEPEPGFPWSVSAD